MFQKLSKITIIAVLSLIAVGSIVRSTGSGMGCPDWPTCFGKWIPPVKESQLPPNYQQHFSTEKIKVAPFNPIKTWTEYLNRLLGVSIGLLITATAIAAWPLRNDNPIVFKLSALGVLLVGFQGWLGAKVVASNLTPFIISLHMFLAIILILTLLSANFFYRNALESDTSTPINAASPPFSKKLLQLTMGVFIFQMGLGIQVREKVDHIAKAYNNVQRENWMQHIVNSTAFTTHRSFSWIVLFLMACLIYQLLKSNTFSYRRHALKLIILLSIMMGSGIILAYLNIPAWAQPIHLVCAAGLICVLWEILLSASFQKPTTYLS